jgi:hypothetical protein
MVTLECAKAQCGDDAAVVIGGFSLCGEHKGDYMEVAAAFYEQMTVEQLQAMAGAISPLMTAFYEQGGAMSGQPPAPPTPGSVNVGIVLTYDREAGKTFIETMALFAVIVPQPLEEGDRQDHPVTAEEFGRPRTMSITMPSGQIKIDMRTGEIRKLLTPGGGGLPRKGES